MKKIFISFAEYERRYLNDFISVLNNPNNILKGIPIYSREDKRNEGKEAIDTYIKEMITESDIVICLIGDISHDRPWLEREVELATSIDKKMFGVRIRNTSGGPPKRFTDRSLKLVKWDVNEINSEVERINK